MRQHRNVFDSWWSYPGRIIGVPGNKKTTPLPWYKVPGVSNSDILGIYQPYGSVSLAESYQNKNNPGTNDATVNTAPVLSAQGWFSDGARSLGSPILASQIGTAVVRLYQVDNFYSDGRVFGAADAGGSFGMSGLGAGFIMRIINGTFAGSYPYNNGSSPFTGVMGMSGKRAFINGVYKGDAGGVGSAPALPIKILNSNGVAGQFMRGTIMLMALYGPSFSDAIIGEICTKTAAYLP